MRAHLQRIGLLAVACLVLNGDAFGWGRCGFYRGGSYSFSRERSFGGIYGGERSYGGSASYERSGYGIGGRSYSGSGSYERSGYGGYGYRSGSGSYDRTVTGSGGRSYTATGSYNVGGGSASGSRSASYTGPNGSASGSKQWSVESLCDRLVSAGGRTCSSRRPLRKVAAFATAEEFCNVPTSRHLLASSSMCLCRD